MLRRRPVQRDQSEFRIVPANEASWEDLQAIFGVRGYPASCRCQRFKLGPQGWTPFTVAERSRHLEQETRCGQPGAATTSGLVAYLGSEPVGWCAVEPRKNYQRLPPARVAFAARGQDKDDPGVWAVTCFATRAGFRRIGVCRALTKAAVNHARTRGARALEGYPMITEPGEDVTWGELHVGNRNTFAAAGFGEVAHPTLRRVVMRIEFEPRDAASSLSATDQAPRDR